MVPDLGIKLPRDHLRRISSWASDVWYLRILLATAETTETHRTCPDVTTTENKPFATLSISASISVSEVEGALRM
jgi:hypothetical protein